VDDFAEELLVRCSEQLLEWRSVIRTERINAGQKQQHLLRRMNASTHCLSAAVTDPTQALDAYYSSLEMPTSTFVALCDHNPPTLKATRQANTAVHLNGDHRITLVHWFRICSELNFDKLSNGMSLKLK